MNSKSFRIDSIVALSCCLFFLILYFVSWPFARLPLGDSFSYDWSVLQYLNHGKLIYGWATPMLGAQIYYGAVISKLFGFSFQALAFSILPIAIGTIIIIYFLFRNFLINRTLSALGTLTIISAPFFFTVATKFVTDVPNLFIFTLSIFAFLKSIKAKDSKFFISWLIIGSILGIIGGTIRQTTWMVPLFFIPLLLLYRPQKNYTKVYRTVGFLIWLISFAIIMWLNHWFTLQPYTIQIPLLPDFIQLIKHLPALPPTTLMTITTIVIILLPILIPLLVYCIRYLKKIPLQKTILTFLIGLGLLIISWKLSIQTYKLGFSLLLPDTLADFNLPNYVYIPLLLITVATLSIFISFLLFWLPQKIKTIKVRPFFIQPTDFQLFALCGSIYLCAHVAIMVIRGAGEGLVFDRYLLPVFVFVIPVLLYIIQSKLLTATQSKKLYIAPFILICIYAGYSACFTHDIFAFKRGIVTITDALMNNSIPREQISASFEFDGWTELLKDGYINDPDLINPPGAFHPNPIKPFVTISEAWQYTYTPRYYVVIASKITKVDKKMYITAPFAPVPVSTWLFGTQHLIVISPHVQ